MVQPGVDRRSSSGTRSPAHRWPVRPSPSPAPAVVRWRRGSLQHATLTGVCAGAQADEQLRHRLRAAPRWEALPYHADVANRRRAAHRVEIRTGSDDLECAVSFRRPAAGCPEAEQPAERTSGRVLDRPIETVHEHHRRKPCAATSGMAAVNSMSTTTTSAPWRCAACTASGPSRRSIDDLGHAAHHAEHGRCTSRIEIGSDVNVSNGNPRPAHALADALMAEEIEPRRRGRAAPGQRPAAAECCRRRRTRRTESSSAP